MGSGYSHTRTQAGVCAATAKPLLTLPAAGGGQGVLLHDFHRAQIIRRLQVDSQPEATEPIYKIPKVQDALAADHSSVHQKAGHANIHRPQGGLLACPNTSGSPQIPAILHRGTALPIQSHAVRPVIGPSNVYQALGRVDRQPTGSIHQTYGLPGRYTHFVQVQNKGRERSYRDTAYARTPRIHSQCGEKPIDTYYQAPTLGSDYRYSGRHCVTITGETGQYQTIDSQYPTGPSTAFLAVQAARNPSICNWHRSMGQIPYQDIAMVPFTGSENQGESFSQTGSFAPEGQGLPEMVDIDSNQQGISIPDRGPDNSNNRCQPYRMGCPRRSSHGSGTVDDRGPYIGQHKLPGIKSGILGSTDIYTSGSTSARVSAYGQRGDQGPPESSGGHKVTASHGRDGGSLHVGRTTSTVPNSRAHCGRQQYASGLAESVHLGPVRVEVGPKPFSTNSTTVWPSAGGSLRQLPEHPASKVLLSFSTARSGGDQRSPDILAAGTAVRVPANKSDTTSGGQTPAREGGGVASSPSLASAAMVLRPGGTVGVPAMEDPGLPDITQPRGTSTSRPPVASTDRLAFERVRLQGLKLPEKVIETMQAARRPSTSRIYQSTWAAFCSFCDKRNFNIEQASVITVLEFLQTGLDRGLAPNTLKRHVAALATIIRVEGVRSLTYHPWVKDFLRGASNQHSPPIRRFPSWDLQLVLKALTKPPFEPLRSIPLRLLSLKTAFLVAITSARRVSELAALSVRPDLCIFYPDRVVLRLDPSFIPKVNSEFHKKQELILPDFCTHGSHPSELRWHKIDVRRAVKIYIRRTEGCRKFALQITEKERKIKRDLEFHRRPLVVGSGNVLRRHTEPVTNRYHQE
ncbi:histone deacetylase 7 isoform X17 [Erythrolamprus reginae]|uniref:histone deacetylase 7 isoform X17 n=1 Tax=Erythrolamprus reginae TaxID=121349 RepID=UPI00396CDFEC